MRLRRAWQRLTRRTRGTPAGWEDVGYLMEGLDGATPPEPFVTPLDSEVSVTLDALLLESQPAIIEHAIRIARARDRAAEAAWRQAAREGVGVLVVEDPFSATATRFVPAENVYYVPSPRAWDLYQERQEL